MESDDYVFCEVRKGMYELKQEAHLAFDNLVKILSPHVYFPVQKSTGLWKHQTRPTVFKLCADNFGIKANSMEDAHQLINSIKR